MDYLDDEILAEILSRLSVKSLVQLKCVNKQFNSVISSHYFAKQQLKRSLKNREKLFLTSRPMLSIDVEKWLIDKQEATTVLGNLTEISNRVTMILGSCHGLICMIFYFRRWIILNPATREFLDIPKPKKHGLHSQYEKIFGFGYDSSTDDYKLLLGTRFLKERSPTEPPPSLDIFSFKSGTWRQIEQIEENCIFGDNRTGTYYNGYVYWLTENVTHHYGILSFNISMEKFGEVELPEFGYFGDNVFCVNGLSSLDGHLLLYGDVDKGRSYIAGWILTELDGSQIWENVYSYSIIAEEMWGFYTGSKVLGITGDGTVVANVCIVNWSSMQYYDPNKDEYICDDDIVVVLHRNIHYVDSSVYVESLVSPRSIFRQTQARSKLRPMRKKLLRQAI